ncbi:NDxxF motif lipoprotein [Staphylococcus arlettae]|uniref:NDxxF motif lipoprotein n=1 Tax=Staphylococcus TaxID=1279 RepID=UPI0014382B0B|nr:MULTISPECIES: NDxxF motif lipoprotein [Staphylococcus]NKE85304.1 NDxxF motif lipoprotein [Staphylococcus arlettae]URN39090.1 NDxxF motif lipoprotein [Staphylococcus arlettae]HAP2020755.1 NDxxF motif lipoprotein [Escherichia coli]HJG55518.1 NDxxF motif lipoprotein [Staphylococcus arlettae]
MKKFRILLLLFATLFMLAACSNNVDDDNKHSQKNAPKNVQNISEDDIFSSSKTGEKISTAEMNKAIKKYLDVNSDIIDNKYLMQYKLDRQTGTDTKITDKQAQRLSKLSQNAVKNDVRFKKFIESNDLPEGYKPHAERILKYFTALNSTIKNVDKDIEELDYQPQNKLNVVDVSAKHAGDVNGKQQKKIKQFLEKHDINSDAIDK